MNNRLKPKWGMLWAIAIAVMMSPTVEVAKAQSAEELQLEATEQGFNLRLPTQGEDRPQLSTIKRDNVLVADLTNTGIDLQGQNQITRRNPFPGVESLTITQQEANTVRVIIRGSNTPPEARIQSVEGGEVTLSLTLAESQTAQDSSQGDQTFSSPESQQSSQQEQVPSLPESETSSEGEPEVMFPDPEVTVNGEPAPNGQQRSPGLQPTRPRATAPPVGDMATSTIDSSPSIVNLGTDHQVSRLVLREAPVREILSLLARSANLNLVFADQGGEEAKQTISVDLENESVQQAFNSILQLSDLQANRRGNTIFVGADLPREVRNLMTRSVRLNQVPVGEAANFLASQGATAGGNEEDGEGNGSRGRLLEGLSVSVDERLNSITLVGEPRNIEIATDFLQQLDARRRQVAVNVKIIDVNLLETDNINSSFSFGIGDSFFVSDSGAAALGFGGTTPPNRSDVTQPGRSLPPVTPTPVPEGAEITPFFDVPSDAPFSDPGQSGPGDNFSPSSVRPNFGRDGNPFQPGISEVTVDEDGVTELEFEPPGLFQFPSRLLGLLEAEVTSGNAKILTDPTLVVQEGEVAEVNLTEEVFGGTELVTRAVGEDTVTVEEPVIRDAGLILDIDVQRIDDNGFVTLSVNPTVSAISGSQNTPVGEIALLQERNLSSGQIRLRDGQTLILAGIIQDQDRTTVSKVPILGDLPIIGSLFRSTNRDRERQEVIVLLTPQIMDDSLEGGASRVNYEPSPEAREMLQQQGYPTPQQRRRR